MDEGGSTQYSHEDETTIEMLNKNLAKNVEERLNSGAGITMKINVAIDSTIPSRLVVTTGFPFPVRITSSYRVPKKSLRDTK